MSDCAHEPRCSRIDPGYCWPHAYAVELVEMCRSHGLDPVMVARVRGDGLVARVREYIGGGA